MNYNPADHYVHVLAVTPGKEEECKATVDRICDAFIESQEGEDEARQIGHQSSIRRYVQAKWFWRQWSMRRHTNENCPSC